MGAVQTVIMKKKNNAKYGETMSGYSTVYLRLFVLGLVLSKVKVDLIFPMRILIKPILCMMIFVRMGLI